jgi:hypothetical protein
MHLFHAHADGMYVLSRHFASLFRNISQQVALVPRARGRNFLSRHFASFRDSSHLFHAHADGISFRSISIQITGLVPRARGRNNNNVGAESDESDT